MNNSSEQWRDFFHRNKKGIIGSIIGILSVILITIIGFWKTMLLIIFACIGFHIGSQIEKGHTLSDIFSAWRKSIISFWHSIFN